MADHPTSDRRLEAAREAFPAWDIRPIFGGYLAVPAGAAVILSTDVDGVVGKIRQRDDVNYTNQAAAAATEAARTEHDFAGWVSLILVRAAAALGSLDDLTAGRPGSWEAGHVDALARGLAGDDAGLDAYR